MTRRSAFQVFEHAMVARIAPAPGELPARFNAPLCVDARRIGRGFLGDSPSSWWIISRLKARDEEMQRRVLDACRRADTEALGSLAYDLVFSEDVSFILRALEAEPGLADPLRSVANYCPGLPEALGIARKAEAEVERSLPTDEVDWVANDLFDGDDAERNLADANRVVFRRLGATAWLKRNPEGLVEAVMALRAFIEHDGNRWMDRLERLDELLALDVKSAHAVIERVEDLAVCRRFIEPGSVDRYWLELGVPFTAGLRTLSPVRALDVSSISLETDVYPNGADRVLDRLARGAPDLKGLIFEEVPHREEYAEPESPEMLPDRYRFRAYENGKVWEVLAGDTSDWIDISAVVGLLNRLLVSRDSGHRFFVLPIESDDADVLYAPIAGVARAVREGVLTLRTDTGHLL